MPFPYPTISNASGTPSTRVSSANSSAYPPSPCTNLPKAAVFLASELVPQCGFAQKVSRIGCGGCNARVARKRRMRCRWKNWNGALHWKRDHGADEPRNASQTTPLASQPQPHHAVTRSICGISSSRRTPYPNHPHTRVRNSSRRGWKTNQEIHWTGLTGGNMPLGPDFDEFIWRSLEPEWRAKRQPAPMTKRCRAFDVCLSM
jgi:hypothetical protein